MADARATSIDLSPYAEGVHEHIVEVSNNVQDIQIDTGSAFRFSELVEQSIQRQLSLAEDITSNALKVAVQHNDNYSVIVDKAMLAYNEAQQVNVDAQNAIRLAEILLEQVSNLSSYYQSLNNWSKMLLLQTNAYVSEDNNIRIKLANNTATTDELDLKLSMIDQTIDYAVEALVGTEQSVRQAEYSLILVMEDIQTLAGLVGYSNHESLLSSGDGSTSLSGSGNFEVDPFLMTPELAPLTIFGGVNQIRQTLVELKEIFATLSADDIQQAMDYATQLSHRVDQVNR